MREQKKQNLTDPNVRKRFVTYKEAAELYSMGLTRIQEHTKMAGATYKMGNKVLVNTDIFEAYLEQYRIPGDYEGICFCYFVWNVVRFSRFLSFNCSE